MADFNYSNGSSGPGSGNPYELSEWAFTNAWTVAQSKSITSDSLFTQALTAGGNAPTVTAASFNFNPSAIEPLVNIPQQAEGASVAKFFELSGAVIEQLAGLFKGYMTEYFPDDQPYLSEAQKWIVNALQNGGTGIDPHIEAQIWDRDRSRLLKEADRLEDELLAGWAARRYPLPPGAAAHQVLQVRKDAADKIAQASRDIAIKQAEIEIENIKFAVKTALEMYSAAMGAAMEYVKALSVGPQSGMQLIPSITDSQAKLISAANGYYQSRIAVEELRMKAALPNSEWTQQARIKTAELKTEELKTRVGAAVSAAQSLGTQAASALNSLHASASVSGSTSNSVGYSYSNDTASAGPTPAWAG